MPHCVNPPRATLRFCHITPSQFCFVVAKYLTQTHTYARTHIHARTDPNAVHSTRNEDKRLEFRVWHQTCFSSRWPATPSVSVSSFHSSLPHRSVLSFKPKTKKENGNNLEERLCLFLSLSRFSSSQETKTNLMEKLKFFFYLFFFFQIQGTMSINIPICLSVCLHSQVQCANIASHKLLDCLLIRRSLQLTSLLSVL